MKELVIVRSRTINNESVPVVIDRILPGTGEDEEREITRSALFKNFQTEVSLKMAKDLVRSNPEEFYILDADGDFTKEEKRIIRVAKEKLEGFVCEYCGAEAKSKAGLSAHIRFNHPERWESKGKKKGK